MILEKSHLKIWHFYGALGTKHSLDYLDKDSAWLNFDFIIVIKKNEIGVSVQDTFKHSSNKIDYYKFHFRIGLYVW